MRRAAAAIAALVLAMSLALTAAHSAAAADLTDTGRTAVEDLRTCLASNDMLNVYYLIDSSGSLEGTDAPTDPEVLRADILSNSLAQLGALEDTSVNWGAGFFNRTFTPTIPWQPWTADSPDELAEAIDDAGSRGRTDWLTAFHGVQEQLAIQPQPDSGEACQMVVWFTDGALNIGDDEGATADALNDLCGQRIDPAGHEPTEGYGALNALRQSGVVVIGTLLAGEDPDEDTRVMWPLVESEGEFRGAAASCGQPDPPAGAVHGAVVDATDADALARVFLELATQIAGGFPDPIAADGTFWIDPGVARFRLVVGTGEWTLFAPEATGLLPLEPGGEWPDATVTTSAGATQIEVRVSDPAREGQWRIDASGVQDVFLFSDLAIVFDPQNRIDLDPDGAAATLVAQIEHLDGSPAGIDGFAQADFTAWLIEVDGERRDLPGAQIDETTGEITIPLPDDVTAAEVVVAASIDPLVTDPHGLELAPITTRQRIETILPDDFPRLAHLPVQLDPLEGSDGEAHGAITVDGPLSGGDGSVCVVQDPTVTSDAADRGETWTWTLDDDRDADGCVVVPQGEEVRISVAAANPQAADSTVRATVPVVLRSSEGQELIQDAPIVFTSTHPVNAAVAAVIALLLMLLGILLPLLILWLLNWRTTRLDVDSSIQRASFPVVVGANGVLVDAPAGDTALSERFRYRGEQRNVRSLSDPDLGRLRARVPWFPLIAPDYVVSPAAGVVVAAARTSTRAASAGERMPDGSMRFRQLPLDAFWAVVVPRAELQRTRRGDDVRGTAVIYHRFDSASPTQYRERIDDIRLEGSTLAERIDRLRAELAQANAAAGARLPVPVSDAAPAAGDATVGPPAPPPRPGAGATPTGSATAPGRSGPSTPSRPGSDPTSGPPRHPGSAPPPPRSGAPPPPRGS